MRKGDGTEVNFYRKVDNDDLETAKKEILAVLDEALTKQMSSRRMNTNI